jgi:hypothetical protein
MLKSKKVKRDCPSATIYVGLMGTEGRAVWDKFVDNCLIRGLKVSPTVVQLLDAENQRIAGLGEVELKQTVSLEALKDRRLQLKKFESRLFKLLCPDPTDSHAPFVKLCGYFKIDDSIAEDFEAACNRVTTYDYTDDAPFTESQLETFTEYLEAVAERRGIEKQIRKVRKSKRKKT